MNFIVHGTYNPASSRFMFWGEGEQIARRNTGRLPKLARHPYALSLTELGEWLLKLVPHGAPEPITTTMWLPSLEKVPQPSPEFAATGTIEQESPEQATIKAWTVDGISLSLSDTLDLLLALNGPPTVQAGADLLYWRKAALYALSLIAAQRVMPTLEKEGFQLRASWKPEFTEDFPALAKLMPPISRTIANELEAAPVPSALLEAFIDAIVDDTVRQAAAKAGLRYPTTPGGKWLTALTSEKDATLSLKGAEADRLFKEWQTWIGQANVAGNAAFRITFRLDAPEDLQHHWKLNYLLQATDDPSLLIPAGQVWRGDAAAYLQQRFDQPQERLLGGLGFAARLFPPIESSLRGIAPQEANLSTDQAYTFLREVAPLLQRSGFGVLLPRWWGGKAANLTARAKLKTKRTTGKSLLTMDTLVNYEWQVMLGGEPISREEFVALAALKQPLVMVRGNWVALDAEQVDAALKFFDQRSGNTTLEEALRLGLDGEDTAEAGIPIQDIDASGWLKSLFESLKHPDKIETILPPAALHGQLRPYQLRGYSWLSFLRRFGLGACLADDMGLGKTLEAIAVLLHARDELRAQDPALIVCPTSVVGNWRRELLRFAPDLTVMIHQGADRLTGDQFAEEASKHQAVITSYPLLARDREIITPVHWSTVILDEAQNIKNSATKQAQAARALETDSRVALTGTPVENRLSELWSIFNFLNPGYLGSEANFRKFFAGPIERTNDRDAARRLKQLTGPFILRRVKTDQSIINDLPEKLEMKVYCTLTTEQGTLYEAVVRDVMEQVEEAEAEGNAMGRRGLVLSMLLRLKQICNHPAQFLKDGSELSGRSGKLARLTEMLEEVYAEGDRALIFTQFAEMGELLRNHLRDVFYDEPLWLHGGTPVKDRESMIQRFQATKGPTVFLLSLKAGGVGLNLTRANHVFHFDRWWNPAVENQATDRAFRIGQTRNVQAHKFICGGTLEEKIDEMIESKKALAESIIGTDESWLTELSTNDLRDLVTLRVKEMA